MLGHSNFTSKNSDQLLETNARLAIIRGMQVKEIAGARKFSAEKMSKVNLFETANFFRDLYCLEPGQFQTPHGRANADKIEFVAGGEASVHEGDEHATLKSGELVIASSGAVRGTRNTSGQRAVLLASMAPNPNAAISSGGGS